MTTDQIAAEARDEVRRYFNKPYYPSEYGSDKVLAIIKSAIEKAYRKGWVDREENLRVVKDAVSREPHASEQGAVWRVLDKNILYHGDTYVALTTNPRCAELIADYCNSLSQHPTPATVSLSLPEPPDDDCPVHGIAAEQALITELHAAHASDGEIWKQANIVCALSGAVAHDCDHYGITRPAWWRAVKKLQKLVNSRAAHASDVLDDHQKSMLALGAAHASEQEFIQCPSCGWHPVRKRESQSADTKRLDWLEVNNATVGRNPNPDMGGNNWYLRTPEIASSRMRRKRSPREAIDAAMSQTKEKE